MPREGYSVTAGGIHIGGVTSGTFSPSIGKGIAMAYIKAEYAETDTLVDIEIRGRSCACRVVDMPFYRSGSIASANAMPGGS